jgi:hypothetical protein
VASRRCLLVIVLATGCAAPDESIDRVFDPCALSLVAPQATAEEHRSIVDALTLWNFAAGTLLGLDEDGTVETLGLEVRFDDAPLAFHGLYDDERGIVFINRQLSDEPARTITVAHELGHSFGLGHVENGERPSLMNPANVSVEPTADDVAALRQLWGSCR